MFPQKTSGQIEVPWLIKMGRETMRQMSQVYTSFTPGSSAELWSGFDESCERAEIMCRGQIELAAQVGITLAIEAVAYNVCHPNFGGNCVGIVYDRLVYTGLCGALFLHECF